jgi:hypothetical protein
MIAPVDISSLELNPKLALDAPNEQTIIRLRWMIVIASCYSLLFSQDTLLGHGFVQGFILIYLGSNASLYFTDQRRFESFSLLSTLVIIGSLSSSYN